MLAAMTKWIAILLVAVLACGSNKEAEKEMEKQREKEKKDKEEKEKGDSLTGRFGSIADKAKEMAGGAADKAKEMGGQAVDKAKEVGGQAVDKAKSIDFGGKAKEIGDEAARKAVGLSEDAVALGKKLKDKLLEAHKKEHDYDFSIETVDGAEHEKHVRGMKELKVDGYGVGYKQFSTHPLGKVYNWQFQISWKLLTGQSVRLSLYTNSELQELALAALLADIVPAANMLLK
jgi:hypothetical protein